ncbi:MAG TPA: glycosyltransferase family 4 protein [Opitutaceae bacterium]|nr:glycosyltransferase family 4 protein [Opitutaceae bacterium]
MNSPPPRLHGEIETSRPLRARLGQVSITGWCLAEGQSQPPPVRLVTAGGTLTATGRRKRADVPKLFPAEPAASECGFHLAGTLPAGVYLASFEAGLTDGSWRVFRQYTLAVETAPLAAVIETPLSPVTASVRIEGWALHPRLPVEELHLHYGNQRLRCETGLPRTDVPELFPGVPHAARAGFISVKNLPVGRGRLRLRARLAGGDVHFARTSHEIAIETDEDNPRPVRLGAARAELGPAARDLAPPSAEPPERPLNILFVLYGDFFSNSAVHVASLANEFVGRGHHAAVVVPRTAETVQIHARPRFAAATYAEAADLFAGGRGPDVIHAWTTRETVRRFAGEWRARTGAKLVVHLEDNERQILALTLGRDIAELEALSAAELDGLVPPDLAHPHRSREFLAQADGITVITDRLREFIPADRPVHTVWPAADARFFFPRPRPGAFRDLLDPAPGATVLFYHGNVHVSNAGEVRELYAAVLALNRDGEPVTLIRTGLDTCDFLGELAADVAPHVLALGQIKHHRHLAPLLALADVFVQPGGADPFNDYRFPSKLPEFFSLGRPVVLPRTNLGTLVRHGIDAYVLDRADAAGIAAAIRELRRDPVLYERLCRGAVQYAAAHFDWRRSAEALAAFYRSLITV